MRDMEAGLVLGIGLGPGPRQKPMGRKLSAGLVLSLAEQGLEAGLVLAGQLRPDRFLEQMWGGA